MLVIDRLQLIAALADVAVAQQAMTIDTIVMNLCIAPVFVAN